MDVAEFPRVGLPEAIGHLATMPAFVEAALEVASSEELLLRPGGDVEFSLLEQACHLRDVEREGYLVRVRRILAEDVPALASFDGAAVARERDYSSQDARRAAREFAAARRELIGILAPLTPGDLAREAIFAGRRICLADLVAMIVEHDRGHREEIEALAEALESP
jgi:hypothetical protein